MVLDQRFSYICWSQFVQGFIHDKKHLEFNASPPGKPVETDEKHIEFNASPQGKPVETDEKHLEFNASPQGKPVETDEKWRNMFTLSCPCDDIVDALLMTF